MKRMGTVITLVLGLAAGAGLFAANNALTVAPKPAAARANDAAPAPATAAPSPTGQPPADRAVTPPPARAQAQQKVTVTWGGSVRGGAASIAIAVKDGVAIGYVCDGNRIEAWFQGTAVDERLALAGQDGKISGSFDDKRAKGTVVAGRTTYTFDIGAVRKPSGLYRATAEVRNAKVRGGWIVVEGRQVGILQVDGVAQPAPALDLATGTVTVNGERITPTPLG
jgi:serine/threonine-protein kinase